MKKDEILSILLNQHSQFLTSEQVSLLTEIIAEIRSIEYLNLSLRAYRVLHNLKIKTIDEFKEFMDNFTKYDFRLPTGAGKKTEEELIRAYEQIKEGD